MNVVELIRVLQNKIATSTSAQNVLFLTKVMEKLDLGMVRTVATYTELLNIPSKETLGEVYFVENEDRLYFRDIDNGSLVWRTISGNLNETAAYSWGNNGDGRLGDNTTVSKRSPVSVVGGFTDWVQVSGGYYHSLGLRENGTAWGWGNNGDGRLGDNTTVAKSSPVSVVGGFTDWVQVSAGAISGLGLRANGTAWGWGANNFGHLGDGTVVNRSSPVSVVGGFTDWIQVSAGGLHSLGLRSNGTAWAWGINWNGRLGDNTTVNKSSPVSVVGGFTDWTQVSAGALHSLGLRANGTAWAWGNNQFGRLGDGTVTERISPVSVVGGFTDWVQVSCGFGHSLGLRANGTAWAWGLNVNGRLGDNTTNQRNSPVSVVGGFTDWIQVSGGRYHSLGLRVNGTAWAWGNNQFGQLGDGTVTQRNSPVSVVGGFTDWISVSGGIFRHHSLGIKTL